MIGFARQQVFLAGAAVTLSFIVALFMAGNALAQSSAQPDPQDNTLSPGQAGAIQQVIADQIGAFQAGEHERAYSHAAPNIKGVFPTVERFISMVQTGYPMVYDPDSYVFGRNTQISGELYQEVIINDRSGKQWQAVYTLRQQEDGSWKITGVKINPYKGASA